MFAQSLSVVQVAAGLRPVSCVVVELTKRLNSGADPRDVLACKQMYAAVLSAFDTLAEQNHCIASQNEWESLSEAALMRGREYVCIQRHAGMMAQRCRE